MELKDFVRVTSLVDGKRCLIRSACIQAVYEYGEESQPYGKKPSHVSIEYDNGSVDVVETFDEVCAMIYNAEL